MIGETREMIFERSDITAEPTYWFPSLALFRRTPRRGTRYRLEAENHDPHHVLERAGELRFTLSKAPTRRLGPGPPYLSFANQETIARMTAEQDWIAHDRSLEYDGYDLDEAIGKARDAGYEPRAFADRTFAGYGFPDGYGMMELDGPCKAGIRFEPEHDDLVKVQLVIEPWVESTTIYRLWVKD